jgi:hypothetical protein
MSQRWFLRESRLTACSHAQERLNDQFLRETLPIFSSACSGPIVILSGIVYRVGAHLQSGGGGAGTEKE